jgi:hypothetical protein
MLHLCHKNDKICEVFHELSSGNHFSNSDLDIEPYNPKVELDLYLVDDTPVYQKLFKSVKPFMSYHLETMKPTNQPTDRQAYSYIPPQTL